MPKSNARPPDRAPKVPVGLSYALTPLEHAMFQGLMGEIVRAKATLYDAGEQLRVAQSGLQNAQNKFALALRSLADLHGIPGDVHMSPDLMQIKPKEKL